VKTMKQMQGKGKDKMHPSSRKGHQMERILLRSDKLKQANRRLYNAKEAKSESHDPQEQSITISG
jgi:hypothetical protein